MKYLILLLSLVSFNAYSQFYLELGIGITNQETDQFQIPLDNPLGRYSAGYEYDNGIVIELEHISSIPNKHDLHGINTFWINKRFNF